MVDKEDTNKQETDKSDEFATHTQMRQLQDASARKQTIEQIRNYKIMIALHSVVMVLAFIIVWSMSDMNYGDWLLIMAVWGPNVWCIYNSYTRIEFFTKKLK
jgi:hypothetical protein